MSRIAKLLPRLALPRFGRISVRRALVWGGAIVLLLAVGFFISWISYARGNQELVKTLQYVEQGSIPNEPASYREQVRQHLDAPSAGVLPGAYSNLTRMRSVTYNAVLVLKPDGKYDYALSVGNDRVLKRYGHKGVWWIQGKVLHTILLEGDAFLASPETRDRVTPARELILDASPGQLTLQAHYGDAVKFVKVQ
jgi:hypothetical protein